MIPIYIVLIATIFIAGLAYYFLDLVVIDIFTQVSTHWASYFTGDVWTFIIRWWNWIPLLLIMLPIMLWVYSQSMIDKGRSNRI